MDLETEDCCEDCKREFCFGGSICAVIKANLENENDERRKIKSAIRETIVKRENYE